MWARSACSGVRTLAQTSSTARIRRSSHGAAELVCSCRQNTGHRSPAFAQAAGKARDRRQIAAESPIERTIASLRAAAPCMESKSARPFDAWSRDRPQRLELDAAASSDRGPSESAAPARLCDDVPLRVSFRSDDPMSQPPDPDDTRSKAREILNRFRLRAEEVLTDAPLVEDFLERADARSKKSAVLRESLAPLRRLIRSYVRGAYRDAEATGDVAWALAAVMYVASPLDAIPDYLPGGLRDDEKVAAWVLRRVDPAIRAYEAWEASIGESTTDLVPAPFVAPSSSARALDVVVLDRVDSSLFNRLEPDERRALPSIAARTLHCSAPPSKFRGRSRRDKWCAWLVPRKSCEVSRPRHSEMVPSSGGNLGIVRDVASKDWAGHLPRALETHVPN